MSGAFARSPKTQTHCDRCGEETTLIWRNLLGGLVGVICAKCNNEYVLFLHEDQDLLTEFHQAGGRFSQAIQGHMSTYEADPAIERFLEIEREMQTKILAWLHPKMDGDVVQEVADWLALGRRSLDDTNDETKS